MVGIYKGAEIDQDKIQQIKNIAYKKYSLEIFNEYFMDVNDVDDLAYLHCVDTEKEYLALGTDWFLCYTASDFCVMFLEWISVDNENKMKQVAEMLCVFKQLFIENNDKYFMADMRHDTSYAFYLEMLKKDILKR